MLSIRSEALAFIHPDHRIWLCVLRTMEGA